MIAEDDRRKLNRPPVPPPALSDEDVAALDHLVHELGARQWKVAIKLGVSPVTVANALKRRGAYSHIPPFCRKPAAMTTPDKKSLNAWTREELLALPVRAWGVESRYDSLLLLSTGEAHDSGWGMMAVIGVRDLQPVEIACQCCDDIEWKFPPMCMYGQWSTGQIRMDCAIGSGALHPWARDMQFYVGAALSSITIEVLPKVKETV